MRTRSEEDSKAESRLKCGREKEGKVKDLAGCIKHLQVSGMCIVHVLAIWLVISTSIIESS